MEIGVALSWFMRYGLLFLAAALDKFGLVLRPLYVIVAQIRGADLQSLTDAVEKAKRA